MRLEQIKWAASVLITSTNMYGQLLDKSYIVSINFMLAFITFEFVKITY